MVSEEWVCEKMMVNFYNGEHDVDMDSRVGIRHLPKRSLLTELGNIFSDLLLQIFRACGAAESLCRSDFRKIS